MDDLRSRAAELIRGPGPLHSLSLTSGSAVDLIRRYVLGLPWDDPGLREQLAAARRHAQTIAARPTEPIGPARDSQNWSRRAAAILEELEAVLSSGHAEPGSVWSSGDS